MAFSWSSILPGILGGIKDYFSRKHELKMKTLDVKFKLTEAKVNAEIRLQERRQDADIDWEKISIQNSGWKDEYFTIFLSAIMCLVFIPNTQPVMIEGFQALELYTPWWLSTAFLGAVGSAFGIRVWTSFSNLAGSSGSKALKESKEMNQKLLNIIEGKEKK
jgi:hypothetical protein